MGFILDGNLGFSISIGGKEIPLTPGTLKALSIVQNRHQIIPTLELGFIDQADLVPRGVLEDGAAIDVTMYPLIGDHDTGASNFRLHNIASINPTMAGHNVTLTGALNQLPLFRKLVKKPYKGPSSSALSQIAGELGVPITADSTQDKMNWMPNNRPMGQFMRHIVDHGYAGPNSAMHLAFGGRSAGDWGLIYKDLNRAIQAGAIKTFASEGFGGDFPILNYSYRSLSGTQNAIAGYSSSVLQPTLEGKIKEFGDVTMGRAFSGMEMNSAVKGLIGQTRRELAPLDLGNTHEKFYEAKNQNLRIKATFASSIRVMTNRMTGLKLLDPVNVQIYNGQTGELNTAVSGKYLVGTRTQHVQGSQYFELLCLDRNGSNAEDTGFRF